MKSSECFDDKLFEAWVCTSSWSRGLGTLFRELLFIFLKCVNWQLLKTVPAWS